MKYYLVGYMYSGKTTIGRNLAIKLGYRWLDLDQFFETQFHTSIPIFFKHYGEDAFRKLEQKLLHTTADQDNVVISTGGGTPCHFDNMNWINTHGCSIYAGKTEEERAAYIQQQLNARMPYYKKAHIIFPADKPDLNQLAELISASH